MKSALLRSVLGVAAASTVVLALAQPASAAQIDATYTCQADTPIGQQEASFAQTLDATAPETVAPGGAMSVVLDPAPVTVPSEAAGLSVKELHTFSLRVNVPTNSTFESVSLEGGSGLDGPVEASESGGVITLTVPGNIAGGETIELPTLTINVTAGESGTVESSLTGTSYSDPGLTFTAVVTVIVDVEAPTTCYPEPSPVLTTTAIG